MTEAKKSWFFFDDEYVCLGADINSDHREFPVFTTINQVLLKSAVTAKYQGEVVSLDPGIRSIKETKWVLHDGIGYIFPEPVSIDLSNQRAFLDLLQERYCH